MGSARDKNPRSWLILLQTRSDGQIPAWLVGYGLLRCFIFFISLQFLEANVYNLSSSGSSVAGLSLSGVAWSWCPHPLYSYGELSGLAPPRELASRAVIYTIYLFLALGPLANCMSWCWISLEFNHALFSLQLNYLYIWLTFSLPGSQIFSETTNKHRPTEFQACLLGNLPVCLSVKNSLCIPFLSYLGFWWAKKRCFFSRSPRNMGQRGTSVWLTPSPHVIIPGPSLLFPFTAFSVLWPWDIPPPNVTSSGSRASLTKNVKGSVSPVRKLWSHRFQGEQNKWPIGQIWLLLVFIQPRSQEWFLHF